VPSSVHNAEKLKRDMVEAAKVKEERRREHTRAGKEKPKAERKSEWNSPVDLIKLMWSQRPSLSSRSSGAIHC